MACISIPKIDPVRLDPARVIIGFLIAPYLSAALLSCFGQFYEGLPMLDRIIRTTNLFSIFGAYPTAIIVGIPAFLYLRQIARPTWINCGISGGCVAALPWVLFGPLFLLPTNSGDFARENGHIILINGHTTLWGLWYGIVWVSQIWAVGLAGGLTFWFIAAARFDHTCRRAKKAKPPQ